MAVTAIVVALTLAQAGLRYLTGPSANDARAGRRAAPSPATPARAARAAGRRAGPPPAASPTSGLAAVSGLPTTSARLVPM